MRSAEKWAAADEFSRLVPAELRLPRRPGYDEILAEAKRLAAEYGESLSRRTFLAETRVTNWDIGVWFVNWSKLRLAAGLRAKASAPRTGPTAAEMTAAMRRLAAEIGPDVTREQFSEATGWNSQMARSRFGGFGRLRESAGLPARPRPKRRVTREAVVVDVARMWTELGRPEPFLTQQQYRSGGRHGTNTVYEHLGSWAGTAAAVRDYLDGADATEAGTLAAGRSGG